MDKIISVKICIIVITVGMFLGTGVLALTVSPPVFELGADPDTSFGQNLKIFNETDSSITVYTSTANFTAKAGEEGVPEFLEQEEDIKDLAEWIKIEKGPITILPKKEKVIPFTIEVPVNADPGGHYAAIFLGTQPPEKQGTGVGIAGKLGSLILLRVSGDIQEQGRLLDFSLKDGKKIYKHLPVDFIFEFENSGNVHLKPQGEILIKNILGRISNEGKIEVNKPIIGSGKNVLPGTIRHFEVSWTKAVDENKDENESISQGFLEELKAEKAHFAFGRYKAELFLDYGTQGKKASATVVFWVLPWHLILVCFLIAIVLITLLILSIKKYNRWIIKKAAEAKKV